MLLIESILSEEIKIRTTEMDTISEYLVLSSGVSITEAKTLITLIEKEEVSLLAKLTGWFETKRKSIITAYNKRIAAAQQNLINAKRGANPSLVDKILIKIDKLKIAKNDALEALAKKYKDAKASLALKAGKSKTLVKISQFAAKHPKAIKTGKIGATAAVGALGYSAYKKRKGNA